MRRIRGVIAPREANDLYCYSLDVRKNFYSQRMVKEWNCLPANIVDAKDVIISEKLFDRLNRDSNSSSNKIRLLVIENQGFVGLGLPASLSKFIAILLYYYAA